MRAIPEADYNLYMRSAAWKATKRLFLAWCKRNRRLHCWFCAETNPETFEVHHVRYDHFGAEPLEDLSLVCSRCHKIHNGLKKQAFSFAPTVVVKPNEWLAIGRGLGLELKALGYELVRNVINPPARRKRRKIGHV